MMRKILRWALAAVLVVAVFGFLAFLYFIPPFFLVPPERFVKEMGAAAPGVADIQDPAERAIAERGRYLVMTAGCIGCHQMPGPKGPQLDKYLAGGTMHRSRDGGFIASNLTPDTETGLARRSDDEVERVMRSGVFPDGHVTSHAVMPWAGYSNWTEEDRHAVVTYLRHLPAVRHRIPERTAPSMHYPAAAAEVYGGRDYAVSQ